MKTSYSHWALTALFFAAFTAPASAQSSSSYEWGEGIIYHLNNDDYYFRIGGSTQNSIDYQMGSSQTTSTFDTRFAFLTLSGGSKKEKLKFFMQADFTRPKLLLDGYFSYEMLPGLSLSFGQRQSIANNRELLVMENNLQFIDRSALSTTYARTGREFGLFVDYKTSFGGQFTVHPALALTSGDGINSFGADSRDPDLGGFKYAARLDVLPLGSFSEGNDQSTDDRIGESRPILALGLAASANIGASDAVGEGHGTLSLYDAAGNAAYPNYRKVYVDLLAKYRHFSALVEVGNATAAHLDKLYVAPASNQFLVPTQISEYLYLGTGFNAQLSYSLSSKWSLQGRYSQITPEFTGNTRSLTRPMQQLTAGTTRYIAGNAAKLQMQVSVLALDGEQLVSGGLALQFGF